jgi:D-alanyl-D-alanine-carboxypeptidase/D-alanyl-D-alanine-endopeptidase
MTSKQISPVNLTHNHDIVFAILAVSLVLVLFTGSFLSTSSIVFSSAIAYSGTSTATPATSSIDKEVTISPPVKNFILSQIVNKSKAAIVIGFVNPNGTRIFSLGNISKANNIPVNENTLLDIGSITKTFTTLLLADMVQQGIVNLNDPIEKYLPASVKVPEFNGHKITFEDLATHTSGLPFLPSNIWVNNKVGGIFNSNYTANQMYAALSNFTLTMEPGSKFQYSDFGLGLLGHILSLKTSVPYEQLVKDRILNVLGMNDTKITLSQDDIKNRFPVGHKGGKEINTPIVPTVIAGAGAFRSTAADMLKYISANLGLIHTKLDDAIQLQHLIRHPAILPNPMNYTAYIALGWGVLTNFGTETITHTGAINGWNANVAVIPTKQIGVVALCSCDSTDAHMGRFDFVLLHITGSESLSGKSERSHIAPNPLER